MPINSFLYPGAKTTLTYEVANSLRFNDDSSDYLNRTPGSAGNRRTFTISCWIKRGQTTTLSNIMSAWASNADSGHFLLRFDSAERLDVSTWSTNVLTTNRLFRDPSAWYHIVCAIDTTSGTADNRVRLYVNGVEETSFSTRNNPSQNTDLQVNNNSIQVIGANYYTSSAQTYSDGYLAEFVLIDGQQLDPTSFGEFDEDSPNIWKPKNVSGLTFGTNGFYLDFENASSLGADVSGNSNNFTVNNLTSVDQTTDTCTNNFSTLNSILGNTGVNAFSEGNTVVEFTGGGNGSSLSTFGLQAGRWYAECKINTTGNGAGVGIFGESTDINAWVNIVDGLVYVNSGQKNVNGTETSGVGATFTDNDIIGVALDITSGDVEFFKNGASQFTLSLSDMLTGGNSNSTYFFGFSDASGATSGKGSYNFGNPAFSISSGNSDANGYGNFEYAVPSGFYALNSKNLAEFG